jgi:hypothetical protein
MHTNQLETVKARDHMEDIGIGGRVKTKDQRNRIWTEFI